MLQLQMQILVDLAPLAVLEGEVVQDFMMTFLCSIISYSMVKTKMVSHLPKVLKMKTCKMTNKRQWEYKKTKTKMTQQSSNRRTAVTWKASIQHLYIIIQKHPLLSIQGQYFTTMAIDVSYKQKMTITVMVRMTAIAIWKILWVIPRRKGKMKTEIL